LAQKPLVLAATAVVAATAEVAALAVHCLQLPCCWLLKVEVLLCQINLLAKLLLALAAMAAMAGHLPLLFCCLLTLKVPPCRMEGLVKKPLALAVKEVGVPLCRVEELAETPLALVVTARLAAAAVHHLPTVFH